MILVVGGQKGGTGKSTLATNIACCLANTGADVLLIDTDAQGTATQWAHRRDEANRTPRVHLTQQTGANIYSNLLDLSSRYQQTVIDAGGRDSPELRSALSASDVLISPIRPSQADLETTAHVDELLDMVRAMRPDGGPRAYGVITMAPTHYRVTETEDAQGYLSEYTSLSLLASVIYDRKAYRDALIEGAGVIEGGNVQAKDEIHSLIQEVYR